MPKIFLKINPSYIYEFLMKNAYRLDEKLELKKMRLSRYSLKEGVLWELLNSGQLVNSPSISNL